MSILAPTHKLHIWVRTALGAAVLFLLLIWLWQFRLAALLRHEAAGQVVSRAALIPTGGAPLWLVPFYTAINYLNTTWETTVVALLIAGTLQTFLHAPVLRLLQNQTEWRAYFAGVLFGLPNPLCTCCAAPLFTGLYKKGAPLGTALATFIAAPSLNLLVLVLAIVFLPFPLALARIVLGVLAALVVPYLAARLSGEEPPLVEMEEGITEDPDWRTFVGNWVRNVWEMTRLALPFLVIGYFLVGALEVWLPLEIIAPMLGDGLLPLAVVALMGTIIMAPTFSEIALVSTLVPLGMGLAPAVALLITAPAVSLPSLIVIGRATGSWRIPLLLGALVWMLGIAGGLAFSVMMT